MNTIQYKGLNLPAPGTRINEGLHDNEAYLQSGVDQINHMIELGIMSNDSTILDFGCGQGRLANALRYYCDIVPLVTYYGIDTDCKLIQWCKDNIDFGHFLCKESNNKRYNPKAPQLEGIPNDDNFFDLIFLNSVFSHMLQDDVSFYLDEFYRVLKPGGHVYLTGFIEIDVPPVEENPRGYMRMSGNEGPLLRVRYDKNYFMSLCHASGLTPIHFFHRHIQRTGQSVVVLKKEEA